MYLAFLYFDACDSHVGPGELRQLRDGSAVKLTVSNYYTPKGNSINKVGIKPDIEVKLASELLNKTEIGHEEDNQLQEALKTLQ